MNLSRLMRQSVVVASPSSRSATGDPVFGGRRSVKARVEREAKTTRQADGSEFVSKARVYTYDEVKRGERCWLPGDDTTDTQLAHEVMRVDSSEDISARRVLYEAIV